MASRTERVANIATIVVCGLLAVHLVTGFFRQSSRPRLAVPYKQGDTIRNTAALQLDKSARTLLLVTASSCQYCTASMPFYQKLGRHIDGSGTRLVAITEEDVAVNKAYLERYGVVLSDVLAATANGIIVRATPTLILVNREGRVIDAWQGKLAADKEQAVMRAVKGA